MQFVYYVVQIGVFAGFVILNEEADLGASGLAIGFISLGVAAMLTAIIYWSGEGLKALARILPTRNHRVIPPHRRSRP